MKLSFVCGIVAAAPRPKWPLAAAKSAGLLGLSLVSMMISGSGQTLASQGCSTVNAKPLTDNLALDNSQILGKAFDAGDQITINNVYNPNGEPVFMFNIDFNYTVAEAVPPFTFSIQPGEAGQSAGRYLILFGYQGSPAAMAFVTCKAASTLTLKQTQSPLRQVGHSYSQTNLTSGGVAPITYSVSAGILPAGTTLNTATGEVSGSPVKRGRFGYTIHAADSTTPVPLTVDGTLTGWISRGP